MQTTDMDPKDLPWFVRTHWRTFIHSFCTFPDSLVWKVTPKTVVRHQKMKKCHDFNEQDPHLYAILKRGFLFFTPLFAQINFSPHLSDSFTNSSFDHVSQKFHPLFFILIYFTIWKWLLNSLVVLHFDHLVYELVLSIWGKISKRQSYLPDAHRS